MYQYCTDHIFVTQISAATPVIHLKYQQVWLPTDKDLHKTLLSSQSHLTVTYLRSNLMRRLTTNECTVRSVN
jgi:hypothetical protein